MIPAKHRNKAAAMGIAATLVGGFEGLRQLAYPDPATRGEPWTVCYGETVGVKKGDRHSAEECLDMLKNHLLEFDAGVMYCVKIDLPPEQEAAAVSLAYNIGIGAFCKSSVARLLNEGKPKEACDAFLLWNKAAGIVFPGLTRRRESERKLCMEGL